MPCPQMLCDSRQPSWIVSTFEGPPQAADCAVEDNFAIKDAVEDDAVESGSLFPYFFGLWFIFFFQIS